MTLAARIIPTVYELWDGIGFDYVQSVEADYAEHGTTLPAYFHAMEALAAEPVGPASLARFADLFDQDAQFILSGALKHLVADPALSAAEKLLAQTILKLENDALRNV